MLDNPGERTLAELVGGEAESPAGIAENLHRFDGFDPLARQPLPDAERAEELGASRAYGVDARVPRHVRTGFAGGDAIAVHDRHRAPRSRERDGKREADQAGADDSHAAIV